MCLFFIYLIDNFCSSAVTWQIKALVFFNWVGNFSMILFVPFDIFLTLKNEREGSKDFTKVIF